MTKPGNGLEGTAQTTHWWFSDWQKEVRIGGLLAGHAGGQGYETAPPITLFMTPPPLKVLQNKGEILGKHPK